MAVPESVLKQVQYDTYIGRKNMPQTALQRVQGFLTDKLRGAPEKPAVYRTSVEQARLDQQTGARALKALKGSRGSLARSGGNPLMLVADVASSAVAEPIGRYIGDKGTDAVVRALDATVGLKQDGRDVNYNPVTNKLESATTGLPSNYKESEADAFLAARRASSEVASLPASAAIPGTGPEGNKVGQDYNTNKPGLQGSGDTEDPVPAASEFVGKEDEAMAIWAKANPTLAAKVKPGQSGYETIQKALGKKTEAQKYNEIETFKSTDEGVTNPADAAAALGNPNLKEAQTDRQSFLSNAIGKYDVNQQNGEPLVSMGSPLAAANYEGLSNLDAIGSYPTPDAENQVIPVSNMFDKEISRRGLNLRTGAR